MVTKANSGSTSSTAVSKRAKKEIADTTEKVITQKVIIRRELKYLYPRNCKTPDTRKAYRRKIRDKITKLQAAISKVRGEARTKLRTELTEYKVKHLANPTAK